MDESASLKWAEWSLRYGPVLPKLVTATVVVVLSIMLFWRGWVAVSAARSLVGVRSTGLSHATQRLESGMAWSHQNATPSQVSVESIEALTAGSGVQWLSAITNPNPEWLARVRFHFLSETITTPQRTVAVLPHTTAPVIEGGIPPSAGGQSVQLVVDSVYWQQWENVPEYLRWDESPFKLISSTTNTDPNAPAVTIRLQNQGALGYKDALLLLRWEEGRRVSGALVVPIQSIASQEVRDIQLRVDHVIPGYARFLLDPMFDPTDLLHVGG